MQTQHQNPTPPHHTYLSRGEKWLHFRRKIIFGVTEILKKKKKGVEAITAIISEREIDIDTHILEEIALKDFIYIIYAFEFLNQNSDMEEGEWGEEKLEYAHI